jgi:hypothetical protein
MANSQYFWDYSSKGLPSSLLGLLKGIINSYYTKYLKCTCPSLSLDKTIQQRNLMTE